MRNGFLRTVAFAIPVVLVSAGADAAPQRFVIQAGAEQRVVFESKAPMETFEGRTDQASGHIEADLENLTGSVVVHIAVDLASFDTGLGLRNTHMRENHLETDSYPEAVFDGRTIEGASRVSLTADAPVTVEVTGSFTLHGVARERTLAMEVSRGADGSLAIAGEFPVLLSEHDIDRPKFLVMKLADEQKVRLELVARPAREGATP